MNFSSKYVISNTSVGWSSDVPGDTCPLTDGGRDPKPFRTVAGRGRSDFEVRGSEFIGHVAPAASLDAAETFVTKVTAVHEDATHNVPAYRVPAPGRSDGSGGMLREYSSDAGEPSGSAGSPALNVLQRRELRNVVAVVTRYYGGTNLGIGGLARSYAKAVTDAVDDAGVTEQMPQDRFVVTVEYDDSGTVRGILEGSPASFEAEYRTDVRFTIRVPADDGTDLRDRIRSATSGRAEIE